MIPGSADLLRHYEGRVGPTELLACRGDLLDAQRLPVCFLGALLVRSTEADDRLAADQRRTLVLGACRTQRLLD
jgi:hypothetical protein